MNEEIRFLKAIFSGEMRLILLCASMAASLHGGYLGLGWLVLSLLTCAVNFWQWRDL